MDTIMLLQPPVSVASHAELVSFMYGERNHHAVAKPFRFAIRLLLADVPNPDSK